MPNPTVVCSLPLDELRPVTQALDEAGFEVLTAPDAAAIEGLFASGAEIGAVVVDGDEDPDVGDRLAAAASESGRRCAILVVVGLEGLERMASRPSAAHGGGIELFTRPYVVDALRWRLEAVLVRAFESDGVLPSAQHGHAGPSTRGTLIGVFSPKGGVGKSAIAANLAVAIQLQQGRQVLLVDADTTCGQLAASMGLEGTGSLAEAWGRGDTDATLHDVSAIHPSGLRLAVLTHVPRDDEAFGPDQLFARLATARDEFDVVVVDLHAGYGPLTLGVLGMCDRIVVPVTPELPAIAAVVQATEVARGLVLYDRLALVVNRANHGVSVPDLERAAGLSAVGQIRSAGPLFVRAANEGRTVVEKFPHERVTAEFEALAARLVPSAVPAGPEPISSRLRVFARRATVHA